MEKRTIPISLPSMGQEEWEATKEPIFSGWITQGPKVAEFEKIFEEFDLELPTMTLLLVSISKWCVRYWYLIPGIPITIWLLIKLIRKFKHGRIGWDQFIIKVPIFGNLIEKWMEREAGQGGPGWGRAHYSVPCPNAPGAGATAAGWGSGSSFDLHPVTPAARSASVIEAARNRM